MIKLKRLAVVSILAIMVLSGCSMEMRKEPSKDTEEAGKITATVIFRAFSAGDSEHRHPIPDVQITVIDRDGKVADQFSTDEHGEAERELTVPIDPKYTLSENEWLEPRGTVTVIAYKEGYRTAVILETPVSQGSAAQPFVMEASVPGERNEPAVQLGNNHRLEIISLVEKYVQ